MVGDLEGAASQDRAAELSGIAGNIAWKYIQVGGTGVAQLVITGLVVRRLGAARFGSFTFILSVTALLSVLDLGLSFAAVRAAAIEAHDEAHRAAARSQLLSMQWLLLRAAAVAMGVTGMLALTVPAGLQRSGGRQELVATVVACGLASALILATSVASGVVLGRRLFAATAWAALAGAVANVVVVFGLAGRLHLEAVGLGVLVNAVISRGGQHLVARRVAPWYRIRPGRRDADTVRSVIKGAIPLLVLTLATQVVTSTDAMVLGIMSTTTAVGLYQLGATLPIQAVSFLTQGYDVVFPAMAGATAPALARATRVLARGFSYLSGLVFGVLIWCRSDVVLTLGGRSASLATTVVVAFSIAWTINTVVHGHVLLVLVADRQSILTRPVVGETVANLVLTVVLVAVIGPAGAAWATLAAMSVSSFVVFPLIARRELGPGLVDRLAFDGVLPAALGIVLAGAAALLTHWAHGGVVRLAESASAALALGAVVGYVLLGREGRAESLRLLRRPSRGLAPR